MSKLKAFVLLDFKTIKPYQTGKNMLLYAVIALFLSAISTAEMGLGIGVMLGTLFISYPFAIGEKSNLDALYVTLSVNRKTIVLGRYLFSFLLNLCAIAFSSVFAILGILGARFADLSQNQGGNSHALILAITALMILIQSVQLPIFFKYGYTKAKFISIVPFALLMVGYSVFVSMAKKSGIIAGLSASSAGILSNGALTTAITVIVLALTVYVSYGLSVAFYSKREF
jgi:ABC-2 type transport system permease protein